MIVSGRDKVSVNPGTMTFAPLGYDICDPADLALLSLMKIIDAGSCWVYFPLKEPKMADVICRGSTRKQTQQDPANAGIVTESNAKSAGFRRSVNPADESLEYTQGEGRG